MGDSPRLSRYPKSRKQTKNGANNSLPSNIRSREGKAPKQLFAVPCSITIAREFIIVFRAVWSARRFNTVCCSKPPGKFRAVCSSLSRTSFHQFIAIVSCMHRRTLSQRSPPLGTKRGRPKGREDILRKKRYRKHFLFRRLPERIDHSKRRRP